MPRTAAPRQEGHRHAHTAKAKGGHMIALGLRQVSKVQRLLQRPFRLGTPLLQKFTPLGLLQHGIHIQTTQ